MAKRERGPVVSIVVPTFGRAETLLECLESIARTVALSHEVICAVVAGDEATRAAAEGAGARVVEQPERGGFVEAANLGFHAARGTWVLQLNDDCTLLPHSIDNAVRFLEAPAHRDVGQAAFFHDSPVRRNVWQQIEVEGVRYAVHHVRGLCYANFGLVARALGERLGWYDERFFMYGADPDFSLRIWHEAGLSVAPCPGALVHHAQLGDERGAAERAAQESDNRALFEKWGLSAPTALPIGVRP